jgi:hypothetical protein
MDNTGLAVPLLYSEELFCNSGGRSDDSLSRSKILSMVREVNRILRPSCESVKGQEARD